MTNAALRGKPDAGNPHVAPTPGYGGAGRLGEGKVAPAKPRRGSLLYKKHFACALAWLTGAVVFADVTPVAPARLCDEAKALQQRLLEIGASEKFVYAWSTSPENWTLDRGLVPFREETGDDPLLYFIEVNRTFGSWPSAAHLRENQAKLKATILREWHARRAVPMVTWHIENPYAPSSFKDPRYGRTPMRYRYTSKGYPQEHRYVAREIVSGTGAACGTGREDGSTGPGYANPRAWFEAQLDAFADFCNTLKDGDGRTIPIVVRLFHECEDDWQWWGSGSATPADFIALFRLAVDRLRARNGVGNMLFCYSPDRYWKTLGAPLKEGFLCRYPGDDCVEMIGFGDSGFGKGEVAKSLETIVAKMRLVSAFGKAHGKICGLCEMGVLDSWNDFCTRLREIMNAPGVTFAFATTYDGIWTFPKSEAVKKDMAAFLARPDVLTGNTATNWLPLASAETRPDPTRFVNPFIGTKNLGSSHPGATWPFGMVQPGPEVGASEPPISGYRFCETVLQGFSQNRVMGTFWACLHDIALLPFAGEKPSFAKMDKASEKTEPGYYAVRLPEGAIRCELTCSERVAYHRYTFERGGTGRVLVDLGSGPHASWGGAIAKPPRVTASESAIGADRVLAGHNVVKCNFPDRDVFFALAFSRPWARVTELPPRADGSPAKRYVFAFDLKPGESVVAKVALSSVDVDGARCNLAADPPGFDFDARRRAAHDAWARLLGCVALEGDPDRLAVFYTMLYQAFVQPQRIDDVDGRVRIDKAKVIRSPKPFFTGYLDTWDTFRAAHPLYTVLVPERASWFAESLVTYPMCGAGGIPSNTVFGRKRGIMGGSHGIPIVADAWLKGLMPGYDATQIFGWLEGAVNLGWTAALHGKGWFPLDPKNGCGQNVAAQLDHVADAAAICVFAQRTGAGAARVAAIHRKRADSWTNLYDRATGAMRPRDSQGRFVGPEPFDFYRQGLTREERRRGTPWGFNEGGYAQWAWHVLHDPERRVALAGGKAAAAEALDRIFRAPTSIPGQVLGYGCTGAVGQYFHGNEPTHHMAYYYQYAGRPDRTQEIVREICTKLYRNAPDGMCGDGDSGQMGAWYVFSALGFYPFDPVGGVYVLGAPQYPRATLRLENGRTLEIVAKGLSEKNKYVRAFTVNGRPHAGFTVRHDEILAGGTWVFEMVDRP